MGFVGIFGPPPFHTSVFISSHMMMMVFNVKWLGRHAMTGRCRPTMVSKVGSDSSTSCYIKFYSPNMPPCTTSPHIPFSLVWWVHVATTLIILVGELWGFDLLDIDNYCPYLFLFLFYLSPYYNNWYLINIILLTPNNN